MGSGTFVEDFRQGLEFTPVAGQPNVYSIHPRRNSRQRRQTELTAKEWDKFEKDVADAFERLP
ncbi:MAG: hypothetical protein H0V54_14275 [Chthoniobacterales bacterium]|nr:hypothetical protein [Chthoniobacterales bacterium]